MEIYEYLKVVKNIEIFKSEESITALTYLPVSRIMDYYEFLWDHFHKINKMPELIIAKKSDFGNFMITYKTKDYIVFEIASLLDLFYEVSPVDFKKIKHFLSSIDIANENNINNSELYEASLSLSRPASFFSSFVFSNKSSLSERIDTYSLKYTPPFSSIAPCQCY